MIEKIYVYNNTYIHKIGHGIGRQAHYRNQNLLLPVNKLGRVERMVKLQGHTKGTYNNV